MKTIKVDARILFAAYAFFNGATMALVCVLTWSAELNLKQFDSVGLAAPPNAPRIGAGTAPLVAFSREAFASIHDMLKIHLVFGLLVFVLSAFNLVLGYVCYKHLKTLPKPDKV